MRDITKQMRLQEYASQIEDWRRSGLTQRQWAKVHGMTLEAFKYRKRKVEDQAEELLGGFISEVQAHQIVQLPDPGERQDCESAQTQDRGQNYAIEISIPGGVIRAADGISPEMLKMLISEVRNA